MRTIKQSLYLLALLLCFACTGCTKYDFVETGKAQSHLDKTMWEYFQTDDYNWSGLVLLIKRAGLEDLFQGKDAQYGSKFTFLGITNHSLRRYLYKTYGKKADGSESVEGAIEPSELSDEETMKLIERMDVETARKLILDCVIPREALLLEDFPTGRKSTNAESVIGTGGKLYTMASGKKLWLYTFRDAYANVPEAGANRLHIVYPETKVTRDIASHNIQTRTGVVHSLQYDFTPGEFDNSYFVATEKEKESPMPTMLEYFQTDDYNWSGLVLLIKRAGLEDLFQGKDTEYGPKFTFLGITNHSLRRYLYRTFLMGAIDPSELTEAKIMQLIERMDVETARKIILDCVIPHEALLLEDFPAGRKSTNAESVIGTGGKLYTMASGKKLWLYTFRDAYANVPEAGANRLHIVSPETKVTRDINAHNIQTRTGVVHSLQYDFTAAEF